jgi:hypothetical protein
MKAELIAGAVPMAGLLAVWVLWVFFLAVMNLQRVYQAGTISKPALWAGMPVLIIGYSLDVLLNFTACTVLFLELPEERTISQRLGRFIREDRYQWRGIAALWFASNFLSQYDTSGAHDGPPA